MIDQQRFEDIVARHLPHHAQRPPYPAPADVAGALSDFLQMAAHRTINDPDPLAVSWRRAGLDIHQIRASVPLTTSDFAGAMESSQTALLRQTFADVSGDLAAVSRNLDLDNFKPTNLPALTFGSPGELPEDGAIHRLPVTITESETTGVLRSFGATVSFSKSVFVTYGAEIFDSLNSYATTFYLLELELLATLLESATLATKTSTALSASNLGVAAAELRIQTNNAGQLANWPLAALIVPPLLEGPAYTALVTTGWPLRIVVNPYLTSATTWYCLTRPELSAPILRLRLRNGGMPTLFVNTRRGIEEGAEFSLEHTVNYAIGGMTGILKVTA
jgi:hypothetical protein